MNSLKTIQNSVKNWYFPLIIGLLFIFIGVYCLFFSYDTFATLSKILGFSIIISGFIEIYITFQKIKENANWQWTMISGVSELAIGFVIINRPEISFVFLSVFVAFMFFLRSLNAISNAIELRTIGVKDWWVLLLLGLFGILLAYILIDNPKLAGQTVAFWIGLGLILVGAFSAYLAIKLKNLKKISKKVSSELNDKWDAINDEIQTKLKE